MGVEPGGLTASPSLDSYSAMGVHGVDSAVRAERDHGYRFQFDLARFRELVSEYHVNGHCRPVADAAGDAAVSPGCAGCQCDELWVPGVL